MESQSESIVSVKDASIFQDTELVLENLNFNIHKGEFVYLIGKTGSGKSSLLKTLYADLPIQQGDIEIAGYQLQTVEKKNIPFLRRKIGVIFQDFQLLYDRNAAVNLTFVMKATGWTDNSKIKNRLAEVLMRVGL